MLDLVMPGSLGDLETEKERKKIVTKNLERVEQKAMASHPSTSTSPQSTWSCGFVRSL